MKNWKCAPSRRKSILNLTLKEKNFYNIFNTNSKTNISPNKKNSRYFNKTLLNKISITDRNKYLERKKEFSLKLKKKLDLKAKSSNKLNEKIIENEAYNKLYGYIKREINTISNEIKIAKEYIKIKPWTFFYRNQFKQKKNRTLDKNNTLINKSLLQNNEHPSQNSSNKSLLNQPNSNRDNQNKTTSLLKYQQFNKNNNINNLNKLNSMNSNTLTNNNSDNFSQISNNKKKGKAPLNKKLLITTLKNTTLKNSTIDLTLDNNDSNIFEITTEGEFNSNKNCRLKTLCINNEPNWYKNNGILQMKIDKKVFEYKDIQKSFISEEMMLIVEDMNNYLLEFYSEQNFSNYLKKSNNKFQRTVNINIEQCIALMLEISYLLIGEYKDKLDLFMSNIIPLPNKDEKRYISIYSEFKEFTYNSTLINKTYNFLLKCYDTYSFLTSKGETSFPISKFALLQQYLDRLRFSLTIMKQDAENLCKEYQDNHPDKKIINNFLEKLDEMNNTKNEKVTNKKEKYNSGVDKFKYERPKFINEEIETKKIWRINKVFGKFEMKENRVSRGLLNLNNNKHINFLLKYANQEFRTAIIAERMRQKNLNG